MRYCKECERKVKGTKKFSWVIFLLGLLTFGTLSILYLIYYILAKRATKCPICGVKTKGWFWQHKHKDEMGG